MDLKKITFLELVYKLKAKIRFRMYSSHYKNEEWEIYARRYASYRHSLIHKPEVGEHINYLAAIPNPGAGIGHQMANWMAGYYYAKLFGLNFSHIPFSNVHKPLEPNSWDAFLGFGEGEISYKSLQSQGYKTIRMPLFNGENPQQLKSVKKIIKSYSDQKVVFLCEQDQFLRNLPPVALDIQKKFFNAPNRGQEHVVFDKEHFNIAIHVRRGDIMADLNNPNLAMRFLSNDYFEKVLTNVVEMVKPKISKPIHIYFFSQGNPCDYPEFKKFENIHWCMDWDAQKSFLHMVYADVLITSKSSFSYKPALLNKNIKVCPKNFWHSYPDNDSKWILCEKDGSFDVNKLEFF